MLVDLTDKLGKEASTREQLETLAAEAPTQPEPHTQLGYLVWRGGDGAQAQKEFEKSYELGGRSARMLWDYGRMIESRNPKVAAQALSDLLEREPARSDVRIELATAQYNDNQAGEALKTLAKLPGVSYDEAPRYYSLAASVALKLGDRVQAKALAEMLGNAKKATAADKERSKQLLAYLSQPERPAPVARVPSPPPSNADDGAAPVLRRQSAKVRLGQFSLSGKVVEFVCGDSPKLIVETGSGKKTLLIERTDRVVVTGTADGHAQMACGPLKPPVAVEIEYDPPSAGVPVDGLVRAVNFPATQ
jgi:tetratricopeptide (TPR) repeat protein